jgi:hypothetical protein
MLYHNVLLGIFLCEKGLEVLNGRLVVRELVSRMLRVLGEFECSVFGYCTLGRLEVASD